jgi:hypothetical protein
LVVSVTNVSELIELLTAFTTNKLPVPGFGMTAVVSDVVVYGGFPPEIVKVAVAVPAAQVISFSQIVTESGWIASSGAEVVILSVAVTVVPASSLILYVTVAGHDDGGTVTVKASPLASTVVGDGGNDGLLSE